MELMNPGGAWSSWSCHPLPFLPIPLPKGLNRQLKCLTHHMQGQQESTFYCDVHNGVGGPGVLCLTLSSVVNLHVDTDFILFFFFLEEETKTFFKVLLADAGLGLRTLGIMT